MRTIYDEEADSLFVRVSEAPIHESEEVSPGLILDYDAEGRVVAVEFLRAREVLARDALADMRAA
ncbi:MAG TPA: DUF2283 domain-containing protein [Beijerinckiaceae bacterium]|jgi:uncharacterized protein YuzE